ncbi:hypothetical protein HGRIS_008688 [Hohenbuehelia grisea]|uniref:Uncharacterized protein n=1 Tax=Hohenbuehelia grisea TaxID=104357 RepID=A0ABR3J985_9AGAR
MTSTTNPSNFAPLKRTFGQSIRSAVRRTFQTKTRPSKDQDDALTVGGSVCDSECSTLIEYPSEPMYYDWPADRALSPVRFDPSSPVWTALMRQSSPPEPEDAQNAHFESEMMDYEDSAWGPPRPAKRRTKPAKAKPTPRRSGLQPQRSQPKRDTQLQVLAREEQSWM